MKNLLLTLHLNLPVSYAFKTFEYYCKKHNLHLINITKPSVNFTNVYFEKFIFLDLLEEYDRILYLDSDVLITPHAPNIFEIYSDENFFYAYHENSESDYMDRDKYIESITNKIYWPTEENNKFRYFNAGVMLFSKNHKEFFANFKEETEKHPELLSFGDQTILNYLSVKNNLPFKSLSADWNKMSLGMEDPYFERYSSNFIHYAGPDFYGNNNKQITMQQDYKVLYG